ncbi:hypothetical protein Salat_1437000 [Sesamum alatum]|uniref:Uncharacterized protein n=1 Tax=Sesamum alatum TaxID=300844 RepID=A0AAE1YAL4_9LAMI|nr:hypothetical protein Salat_1437000 [Sesamum alatum]
MSSKSSESSGSSNSGYNKSDSSSSSESSSPMAKGDAPSVETSATPGISCIKYKDLPKIHREYHIPEAIYPTHPHQRPIYAPPSTQLPHCASFSLRRWLRFPIDPHIATLINHLRRKYINARRNIRFVGNLPSSAGSWKDKLLFVRAPTDRPWNVSTECPLLARLSPASIRSNRTLAHTAGVEVDLEPEDVPPTPHADAPARDLPFTVDESHPPLEVVRSPSPAVDVAPLRESIPALWVPEGELPRRKPSGSQSSRSSMRSRQNNPAPSACVGSPINTLPRRSQKGSRATEPPEVSSPKRCRGDKGKRVADPNIRVSGDDKEVVGGGSSKPQSPVFMDVDAFSHLSRGPLIVFQNKPGETSFEMYKVCILPKDQIALANLHHARLEMLGAHVNHQLVEVLHAMSLQCSYWRYDRDDLQAWIQYIEDTNENLKVEVNDAKARQSEAEDRIKELESEKAQAEKRASDALRANEALRSKVRSLRSEVEALKAHETKAFDSGVAQGKSEYIYSAEI